jgi:hypothetical protein
MQRFIALVIKGPVNWTVSFPDFPHVAVSAFPLRVALWRAQREIGGRAAMLKALGVEMTAPMAASEIVSEPGYRAAIPFIIAIPGPQDPMGGNVSRYG